MSLLLGGHPFEVAVRVVADGVHPFLLLLVPEDRALAAGRDDVGQAGSDVAERLDPLDDILADGLVRGVDELAVRLRGHVLVEAGVLDGLLQVLLLLLGTGDLLDVVPGEGEAGDLGVRLHPG